MISLSDQLAVDLKDAMRAKDEVRLRTIRSLRAALTQREIEERQGGEAILSREQELMVLQKQAKQRRESIQQYTDAGREDLAEKEQQELEIITEYLPRQLSDDEIRSVIYQFVVATGASNPQDIGKVMGEVMRELRGRADGRRVQEIARELLHV